MSPFVSTCLLQLPFGFSSQHISNHLHLACFLTKFHFPFFSHCQTMELKFPVFLINICFMLTICSCSSSSTTFKKLEFNLESLTLSSLTLLGDAHWNNGTIRLSTDVTVPISSAGRALYSLPTSCPKTFSTFFSFSITSPNPASIGTGLTFLLSPDNRHVGPSLGLPLNADSVFVAVEFDTLMDVAFSDVNGNHVGVDLNSLVSAWVFDLDRIDMDLKSGDTVHAWIDYSGVAQQMNVSVSYSNQKPVDPVLTVTLDLDEFMTDTMYVGFSGSTQGSTEVHNIDWWTFTASFDTYTNSTSSSPPPMPSLTIPAVNSTQPSPAPVLAKSSNVTISKRNNKCNNQLCKQNAGAVAGVVTAGAFFLALCALFLIWVYSRKFKTKKNSDSLGSQFIKMPKEFTYKELKLATKTFDQTRIIGHGAFGTVYKGVLHDTGDIVAVKRCSHNGQGKAEFLSELSIIGTLRHRNLVRLQGWCHEKGEILLVYDLMTNGSLDKALFESRFPLSWHHRRKILIGVASALAYLHQECENQVIHRDVKTSNVMLDGEYNAKLGDFGLARQVEHNRSPDATVAAGTMGYLAPEYLLTGRATEKTDVFSYGAVVLEVVTGRRPIEKELNRAGKSTNNGNLVEWVWSLHKEGRVLEAADSRLCGEFNEIEMTRVILIGLNCSHPNPLARPSMRAVAQMLVGEAEVPLVPKTKPCMSFSTSHLILSLQDSVSDLNEMVSLSTSSSDHSYSGVDLV